MADLGQDAYRLFGNGAVRLGADIQQIVSCVVRAIDEVAHDRLRSLPGVIRLVISPTFIQRHAGFPGATAFVGDNLLFRRCEITWESVEIVSDDDGLQR